MSAAEEAAARVDTHLEVAIERVLVRYSIPMNGVGAVGQWDRGDLASDLAAAARTVPTQADPESYEAHLEALYAQLMEVYNAHEPHVLAPARPGGTGRCPSCGEPLRREGEPEQRCGDDDPTTMCDELLDALYDLRDRAFPESDAERWLNAPPAADFLEWANDGSGVPGEGRLRDFVIDVLRYDAAERILERRDRPADPRTTRPGGESNG